MYWQVSYTLTETGVAHRSLNARTGPSRNPHLHLSVFALPWYPLACPVCAASSAPEFIL